jgi:hypothetical protein
MPLAGNRGKSAEAEAWRFVDTVLRRHYVAAPFSRDAALP